MKENLLDENIRKKLNKYCSNFLERAEVKNSLTAYQKKKKTLSRYSSFLNAKMKTSSELLNGIKWLFYYVARLFFFICIFLLVCVLIQENVYAQCTPYSSFPERWCDPTLQCFQGYPLCLSLQIYLSGDNFGTLSGNNCSKFLYHRVDRSTLSILRFFAVKGV